jgi:hypothetical protein
MWSAATILAFAIKPIDWWTVVGLALLVLAALYVLVLFFSPSRRKGMATMASEQGLQFSPVLSADQMAPGERLSSMKESPSREIACAG